MLLKQSTARNVVVFAVDSVDNVTGKSGLTLTVTASKNGAAFASISPTQTDLGNGFYNLALTSSHTDTLGDLIIAMTGTAAIIQPISRQVVVELPGVSAAEITAIKAKTDNLPSDPADASDVAGSFSTVNSTLSTIAGYLDTEIAAIKAKTDNLPSDPADASDIDAATDAIIALIGTPAGASVSVDIAAVKVDSAAIKAKTDNLPTDPAAQDIAKNTQFANFKFQMIDTDGDPATGLTVTAQRSIDGGALATCSNAVAEISNGLYKITLSAADLNGDVVALRFSATGAVDQVILLTPR